MRTFVVSSAILLSVANAMSADPAAISTPPAFTWAGPYAGVNAGYGWAQERERSFPARGLTVDLEPGVVAPVLPTDPPFWTGRNNRRHGALVGAQIGYNFQLTPGSGWVLGAEADAQLADFGKHLRGLGTGFFTATPIDPAIEEVGPGEVGNVELFGNALRERDRDHSDAFATARLRLGYAFGRWLVFGTGGLAVTETIYRNTSEPERGAQEAEAPPEPAEDEEPEEAGVVVEPTLFRERQRFNLGWTIGA